MKFKKLTSDTSKLVNSGKPCLLGVGPARRTNLEFSYVVDIKRDASVEPVVQWLAKYMPKLSAGLLMFRHCGAEVEVFLVHPGGPFWKKRDAGAWSIPKGEYEEGEDALRAAKREFEEETGIKADGEFLSLERIQQPGGKVVTVWALEGDCSPAELRSNMFSMEWPPKSGRTQEFPEVDRADWFTLEDARKRILKGQVGFLDRLEARLKQA